MSGEGGSEEVGMNEEGMLGEVNIESKEEVG